MLFDFGRYESVANIAVGFIIGIIIFKTGLFTKFIEVFKNYSEILDKNNATLKEDRKKLEDENKAYKEKYQESLIEIDMRRIMGREDVEKLAKCTEKNRKLEDDNIALKKELNEVYEKLLKDKKGMEN